MFISQLRSVPWRGVFSVFGGFLLQFTMGAFYSFGNMSPYMTSYMRQYGDPSARNLTGLGEFLPPTHLRSCPLMSLMSYLISDFVVVQSTWGMTQGTVMPLSGFLIAAIGDKAAMVAGSIIFSSGCALTYFTISQQLWMVAATYGFVSAFGQNIALIPTLTTGMKWFPKHKVGRAVISDHIL